MTPRRERFVFAATALALWLLFVTQALLSPILLDDWFPLRYWRDHEFSVSSLWTYGHHNYFNYNPRIGEVFLAIVDGSQVIHLIVTPLVQLALVPIVFAIAFARWLLDDTLALLCPDRLVPPSLLGGAVCDTTAEVLGQDGNAMMFNESYLSLF